MALSPALSYDRRVLTVEADALRRVGAIFLVALFAQTAGAPAAVDLPSVFSVRLTRAVFAHEYDTVWSYLHPTYQKVVSRTRWQRCERQRVAHASGIVVESVKLAQVRRVPSRLPLLGPVTIEAVNVQVLYRVRGQRTLSVAVENAYWVKYGGRWRTVWPLPVYNAYRAGGCFEPALY
jgi:hypothetical protein